jgi:hypothetical protein
MNKTITLDEKIKLYNELQIEADAIAAKLAELKESILTEFTALGVSDVVTPDNIQAKVTEKTNIKYDDEAGIIKYLKEKGLTSYIVEKVSTTPLNKELKKGLSLTEDLKKMYTQTTTKSLSVKSLI